MAGLPVSIQSDATFEDWSIKDRLVKRLALSYFYQRSEFDVPLVGIAIGVRYILIPPWARRYLTGPSGKDFTLS